MNKIECTLCPHRCKLATGDRGNCRVRTNVGGKLFSLVYGNPCAVHIDPIEKKPFFHLLPGSRSFSIATAGCNLHCQFCQNWEISQSQPEETRHLDLPPEAVVNQALSNQCQSIAYTYSEPIVFYEYTLETSRLAREQHLRNVLVTAGYIEQPPLLELCNVVHAANLDIKSMRDDFYRRVCGATLQPVLETAVTLKKRGIWLEITYLIVPTLNDNEQDIREFIHWVKANCGKDTPLHFSRFWPLHQLQNLPPTPEETLTHAWDLAKSEGMTFAYVGNVPGHPGNNTCCPSCGKLLIERLGYDVIQNHCPRGHCEYCNIPIAGIWE